MLLERPNNWLLVGGASTVAAPPVMGPSVTCKSVIGHDICLIIMTAAGTGVPAEAPAPARHIAQLTSSLDSV